MLRLGDGLAAGSLRPCVTCGEWLAWLLVDVWYERDVKDWPGARAGPGRDRGGPPAGKAAGSAAGGGGVRRRLRIAEIVDELCPVRPVAWISHGEVIEALVANRLTAPAPMVRVQEWAAAMAVDEAYGVTPQLLNDDRIARALNAVAPYLDEITGGVGGSGDHSVRGGCVPAALGPECATKR